MTASLESEPELFAITFYYEKSAYFDQADQRTANQRFIIDDPLETYEGPAAGDNLSITWSAHESGTRNWAIGTRSAGINCRDKRATTSSTHTWPHRRQRRQRAVRRTDRHHHGRQRTQSPVSFTNTPDFENPADQNDGQHLPAARVQHPLPAQPVTLSRQSPRAPAPPWTWPSRSRTWGPRAAVTDLVGNLQVRRRHQDGRELDQARRLRRRTAPSWPSRTRPRTCRPTRTATGPARLATGPRARAPIPASPSRTSTRPDTKSRFRPPTARAPAPGPEPSVGTLPNTPPTISAPTNADEHHLLQVPVRPGKPRSRQVRRHPCREPTSRTATRSPTVFDAEFRSGTDLESARATGSDWKSSQNGNNFEIQASEETTPADVRRHLRRRTRRPKSPSTSAPTTAPTSRNHSPSPSSSSTTAPPTSCTADERQDDNRFTFDAPLETYEGPAAGHNLTGTGQLTSPVQGHGAPAPAPDAITCRDNRSKLTDAEHTWSVAQGPADSLDNSTPPPASTTAKSGNHPHKVHQHARLREPHEPQRLDNDLRHRLARCRQRGQQPVHGAGSNRWQQRQHRAGVRRRPRLREPGR